MSNGIGRNSNACGKMCEFDKYVKDYRSVHTRNVQGVSGVDSEYFSEYKIAELARRGFQPKRFLDFGCGDGNTAKHIRKYFPTARYYGVDVAEDCIKTAKELNGMYGNFVKYDGKRLPFKSDSFDMIFVSCVMHHIKKKDRRRILRELFRVLKPSGRLVIFEHNTLNPVTRKLVNECPFDVDAILISPLEMLKMMRGHRPLMRFTIFFPRKGFFKKILWLERLLWWCPIGGQYYVVCIK